MQPPTGPAPTAAAPRVGPPPPPPEVAAGVRERRLVETFTAVTDGLVSGCDVPELMSMLVEQAVELLDVTAAAVVLADAYRDGPTGPRGLTVAAASSQRARWFESFAVELASGPGVDCVATGRAVSVADLTTVPGRHRWPRVATTAGEVGFRAVHALPMRLREETVGALTLHHAEPHLLDATDLRLAQSLADATTVGLLHQRAAGRAGAVADALTLALEERRVVDQATGVLAAHGAVGPDAALVALRRYARSHDSRLVPLCRAVVDGRTVPAAILRPGATGTGAG
ncbi:GAF and ANTAR domain-containing protein [Actinomycetospora atypica]|uniref:GAF and ANTAR domain-containing protein n=1 Tax=Actinomycetospora atypica TaxID=1290095 RepID=A0ABV9YIY7_9PSEU